MSSAINATAGRPFPGEVAATRVTKSDRPAIVGLLTVYATLVAPTLGNPLTEYHAFRQTQTAFVTQSFLRHGIDLLHPIVPVYGPSSQVPFDMPWYEALAALAARVFRLSEVVALRTTSLAFTLVTAIFVYALTKRLAGRSASIAATALFLFSPFTMQWGRASLIESFTTAMTLGWVCSVVRLSSEDDVRSRYRILGALAGILAATSKITTFLPWGAVALPTFVRDLRARRWRAAASSAASGGLAIASGLAWTRHADVIKAANPYTAWLTSGRLQTFNTGTVEQRLSLATWTTIFERTGRLVLGPILLVLALAGATRLRRTANTIDIAAIVSVTFVAVGVFTNLYFVHDYYQAAIVPALAIPAGIAAAGVGNAIFRGRIRVGTIALCSLSIVALLLTGSRYVRRTIEGAADYRLVSDEAAAATPPHDGVIVTGLGWSPELLYYADRWGVMADGTEVTAKSLVNVPFSGRLATLVTVHGFGAITRDIMASANWVVPVSDYTFNLSIGASTKRPIPRIEDGGTAAVFTPSAGTNSGGSTVTLPCDQTFHRIGATTIELEQDISTAVIGGDNWLLPVLRGRLDLSTDNLRCANTSNESIRIRVVGPASTRAVSA